MPVCKACGTLSEGKYCPDCGQSMTVKRITFPELLHEAAHLLTHVEHGFLYTLKMLVTAPGKAQKEYIEGTRAKHQKPFSMFFLCATISALLYYWINTAIVHYMHYGSEEAAEFFHSRFVLLHICLFPVYCIIPYLCFRKAGYNFGEIAVYQLYTFSFIFLFIAAVQVIKFVYPDFQTRYIELPAILIYAILTNLTFFSGLKRITVVLLSLISIVLIFFIASFSQDKVLEFFYHIQP